MRLRANEHACNGTFSEEDQCIWKETGLTSDLRIKFVTMCLVLALVLAAASDLARASDQATIEAAKKEGTLMIYNSMTPSPNLPPRSRSRPKS